MNRVLILSSLLLLTTSSTLAKSWRGIVPLHSTRPDVQKLLGNPASPGDWRERYDFRGYTVFVYYAIENVFDTTEDCDNPGYYWWGYYHAPVGTVLSVEISFDHDIPLAKLKIPNFNRLPKDEPDSTGSVDYFDAKRGIQYSVRKRKVQTIEYGPSAVADTHLRCAPDAQADTREAHANEMCSQLFGPMIDSRMRLYAVNPSYVLKLIFDRHGDVVGLHVEPKHFYDWYNYTWEERDNFRNLSETDYERVLARLDEIKSRGPLVKSATTNASGWREETYRYAVVERDEVANVSGAKLVRWFNIFYFKRRAT